MHTLCLDFFMSSCVIEGDHYRMWDHDLNTELPNTSTTLKLVPAN